MGFTVLPPFLAFGVQGHGYAYQEAARFERQLGTYKAQWARRLERLEQAEPIRFPGWNDWDETGRGRRTAQLAGDGSLTASAVS